MFFKSSASPKENPGSKRLRRALGLLLGSALAVQYKQDRIFRASVNLQLVMVLNYLYAAYNLLIGLQSGSVWLLSLGIYTLMLAIVRTDLTLSHHRGRKLPPDALPRHESRCYRRVAWSLLALNVPIGGLTLLMVSGQSVSALPGHLIYLSALYTFVMMFLAISNLIRFRKLGSPILSAAKVLSLVAALLSLLTLQSALIDRFGTAQGSFRLMMTRLTGSAVYASVLIIAVWMLRRPLTISANGIEEELTAPCAARVSPLRRRTPCFPKRTAWGKSKSPKAKKSPSGKQFAPDGIFHYALTFPKLSGISTTKCGWHDKSPADTRSSGSSSAFSGYRRRKSATGAIGHDAFAAVL